MSNPILETPANLVRAIRIRKRVLILDPDQKSLKRLIDCLFICGFQLDNLHPVRMAASLDWALQKYMPHVLVVDYRLSEGQQTGIQILQGLQSVLPFLEQIILITPPLQMLSEWEARRVKSFCQVWNVKALPKPVNRFTLKQILDQAIRDSLPDKS
jgi:CheY-like chemotaxis protein